MNPIIKPATASDAEDFLRVLVASFEQYRDTLDPPSGVFKETPHSISQKIEAGGGYLAYDESSIVGVVLYQFYPEALYLGRLGVLQTHRGQRIAHQLIAAVEQTALAHDLHSIQLGVRIDLKGNQRLFTSLGYEIISYDRHEGYSEITSVTMLKRL